MKKRLFSCTLFLLGLAGLLALSSRFFLPKNNTPEAGIQDYRASGFLSEPENSLDYLVLGDSIPMTGFDPWVIWADWGYTGYVCATTGQNTEKSAIFAKAVFARQHPKVVFLEANQLYKEYTALEAFSQRLDAAVPVLQYHDNWKFLRPAQALQPVNYQQDVPEKGYYLRKAIQGTDPGDYMQPTAIQDPIPTESVRSLERLARLCREQGTQLVLLSLPSPANWSDACHRAVAALADRMELTYLDLNLEELGIDWSLDTLDAGDHLNYTGAAKASAYLGRYLAQTGLLQDKRQDPDYDAWRQDWAFFEAAAAAAEDTL